MINNLIHNFYDGKFNDWYSLIEKNFAHWSQAQKWFYLKSTKTNVWYKVKKKKKNWHTNLFLCSRIIFTENIMYYWLFFQIEKSENTYFKDKSKYFSENKYKI